MIILTSLSKSSQAGSVIAARHCVRNVLTALALPVVALLSAAPALAAPDLDVSVVTSNPTPAAGALFNYVVVITNRGTTTATGITLLDPLPDGITFQSATPVTTAGSVLACSGPAVNANGTVSCTGFLLANATSTITISAKVDQTARSGPRINSVGATSTAAEATPNVFPDSAFVEQEVLGAADLGITKVISNATPTAGGASFAYTLTVTNNGPNDAMGIVVLDPLPPGVIFQNVSVVNNPSLAGWGLTCSGPPNATNGTVQCTGNLPGPTTAPAATSTSTITIVAQIVARVTSGVRTNTASVMSNNPEPTPNTLPNTASVPLNIVFSAPLSITKAGPATVSPGATIVYQITVNNSGSGTALIVTISDPLPANTSFLSLYGTGTFHDGCRHSGGTPGTVSCPAVDIPSGQQSLNIVVRLAPNAPLGSLANTATITTAGTGTIVGGTATTTATVVQSLPPVAANDGYVTTMNVALAVPAPGVKDNDTDDEDLNTELTAALVSGPTHGTLTAPLAASGSFTYTPAPGYFGPDSFTYTVTDLSGRVSNIATVSITVNGPALTNPFALTVAKSGSGAGSVASVDTFINCGATCSNIYSGGTAVTLSATPSGGSTFTGWTGACTGVGTCAVTMNAAITATATFASTTSITNNRTLDIDNNGSYDALTDGLMVIRFLFGLTGSSLISNAVAPGAPRSDAVIIGTYLDDIRPLLDIDGNGQADALTDGLMVIRYLFGLRGGPLIQNAVGNGVRTTAAQIEPYIQSLAP